MENGRLVEGDKQMNGVEILSSETIYSPILPEYWLGIGLGCALLLIVAMGFCFANEHIILGYICVILSFSLVFVGCIGVICKKDHIEYKVTVDDSVSMNEFLNKYEILEQEGKIYTVRERE